MKSAIIPLAILFLSTVAFSATIFVPDHYATIQGAINASTNGDTIIVRPGTYYENIDFVGKSVTLQSELGSSVTKINGNKLGSVVTFQNGEDSDAILIGFKISNGLGDDSPNYTGGGITCLQSSSPTIKYNFITNNSAQQYGGGVHCRDSSSPTIIANTIYDNDSDNGKGGGIYCDHSDPTISSNILSYNRAWDCMMSQGGGGIYGSDSNAYITNNIITNNKAIGYPYYGAGQGGGIYLRGTCSPTVVNNTLYNNTATDGSGGGINCSSSSCSATITNNTIVDNAALNGAGIYGTSSTTITNSIVRNSGPSEIHGYPDVTYCNVRGGWPGAGNIDADPLFFDSASHDFRLTWSSPCINAGNNSAVIESYDFELDPRIAFGRVDMGIDEYYYHLYQNGAVVPGSTVDLQAIGYPNAPVTLYLGDGLADPPYNTQHGEFYLNWPPLWHGNIGNVSSNGFFEHTATVPSNWMPGSQYPIQALVGPWNGPWTRLTNSKVLVVQ